MVVYKVRLRHVFGDLGPYEFEDGMDMANVAQKAFEDWPTEGQMAVDPPMTKEEVKLIMNGRIMRDSETLRDVMNTMGDIEPDFMLTLHAVVRPPRPPKKSSKRKKEGSSVQNSSGRRASSTTNVSSSQGCCVLM